MSKELKALAEAATPGPWGWDGPVWGYDAENEAPWLIQERGSDVVITGELQCSEANAAYISAADPATVLSLIAERDALLAERDALETENKRLDLMVAQADHNYDMDRNRMMYLLRAAHDCLEQWNLKYPRLAKRGEEFSSEHTCRQIRAFVPEYREADAALQGAQP